MNLHCNGYQGPTTSIDDLPDELLHKILRPLKYHERIRLEVLMFLSVTSLMKNRYAEDSNVRFDAKVLISNGTL